MKAEIPVNKETQERSATRTTTRTYNRVYASAKLNHAIKSVYRRYGVDLPAFFRDAYEAERAKRESVESRAEACLP